MLKNALQNVRALTVTVLLGTVALFVIPVSAQKSVAKEKAIAEKSHLSAVLATANYRSPGSVHKITVTDRQTVNALTLQGAQVIADYGSYVLLQANDALANTKGAQVVDENNVISLNAGAIDTTAADAQAKRTASNAKGGKGMRLIQFAGPIRPEWYQALVATGARVVTYIPSNSYLVYGTSDHLQKVQNLAANKSVVQWDGAYGAAYRLDPAVTAAPNPGVARPNFSAKGNEQFIIQLVEDASENVATLALIDSAKREPIISQDESLGYVNVKVALPRDAARQIAERGDVVSIQPWVTPVVMCERQDQIMAGNLTGNGPSTGDYLAYLTGKGFNLGTAASFGVNLSDYGLDNGTTTPDHFVFYTLGDATNAANSRVAYVVLTGSTTAPDLRGCKGHGHLNASIVGGYVPTGPNGEVNFGAFPHADGSGFRWGLGIAPFVKLGVSVIFGANGFSSPDYEDLESDAYNAGMRISSNSWGNGIEYNSDAQRYDALVRDAQPAGSTHPTAGNQEYTIVFAAGNYGPGLQTIPAPGTGKNVITVGASENVNPFGGADGCGHDDSEADNANDIATFSIRGPTTDQRTKPEIVGPGTHVSGAAPQNGPNPTRTGNGSGLACFANGTGGVCGGVGSRFFPAGQQWYTASSGTSHSCPAVAGTVALYRQYFSDHSMTPPSPALNKALLIDSSRYLNGVGANDTLPSNSQGMGEPNLNTFFDIFGSSHVIHDELPGDLFTASGQQRTVAGNVGSATKPFRVTLVWTDPPGPTSGNAYVNNLDLEVTVGGNTYKGNVFSGANSITGGSADTRNNFESVFVPAGVSGSYIVKVTATNIAGDGVPGNGNSLDQDFALVVYNGNETPVPVIVSSGTTLTGENCSPGNGVIDPGETVSVSVCLQNVGMANASNLTGTLQATGGVTNPNPSGPQSYGALIAGGAAVCKTFTFTASGSCGGTIAGTVHLQAGATDLGNVTFNFTMGVVQLALSQNFDGVTAPALPSGWTADQGVNAAGAPPWATSNSGTPAPAADSAPNVAYTQDPVNTCDNRLYTPPFMYMGPAQMSCRMNYDLEASSAQGIAYDAGVLEISINGGAYTDIIAAGGSWVTGGYNQTGINTGFSNPLLPSRPCWSGISGGFVTTTVNLPPSGVNQPVKLRWRMGSDIVTSRPGWRVDNVTIAGNYNCCPGPPTVTSAVSRKAHGGAGTFDVSLPLTGTPGIECRSGQGTGSMDHQMVVTFTNPVTVGGASVTSGTGSVVGSPIVAGNVVTINLTGVTNIQTIMVTLSNVSDGVTTGNVVVPMSVLLGDTSGSGEVNGTDVSQTKAQSGHAVSIGNFREDVTVSGAINSGDVFIVNSHSGTALP
jgi:subtilase family protein